MASSGQAPAPEAKTGKPAAAEPMSAAKLEMQAELEWLRFREETLGPAAYSEPAGSKLFRKMTENPFVPIGAFATLGALSYGLWCFRKGRNRDSQLMMRTRIAAQGFTIIAILGGVMLGVSNSPSKDPIK